MPALSPTVFVDYCLARYEHALGDPGIVLLFVIAQADIKLDEPVSLHISQRVWLRAVREEAESRLRGLSPPEITSNGGNRDDASTATG